MNFTAAFTPKAPGAASGTAVRNQPSGGAGFHLTPLVKMVTEGLKRLAKEWNIFNSEPDLSGTNPIHQIAWAYYFNQLP